VGTISDLPPVAELIARLDAEYRTAMQNSLQLAQRWAQ
jgi:nitronate monooxygenase